MANPTFSHHVFHFFSRLFTIHPYPFWRRGKREWELVRRIPPPEKEKTRWTERVSGKGKEDGTWSEGGSALFASLCMLGHIPPRSFWGKRNREQGRGREERGGLDSLEWRGERRRRGPGHIQPSPQPAPQPSFQHSFQPRSQPSPSAQHPAQLPQ